MAYVGTIKSPMGVRINLYNDLIEGLTEEELKERDRGMDRAYTAAMREIRQKEIERIRAERAKHSG